MQFIIECCTVLAVSLLTDNC